MLRTMSARYCGLFRGRTELSAPFISIRMELVSISRTITDIILRSVKGNMSKRSYTFLWLRISTSIETLVRFLNTKPISLA